jgi:hypothetical protein
MLCLLLSIAIIAARGSCGEESCAVAAGAKGGARLLAEGILCLFFSIATMEAFGSAAAAAASAAGAAAGAAWSWPMDADEP